MLDDRSVDWVDEIALTTLNIDSLDNCICGQLRGVVLDRSQTYDIDLGFDVPEDVSYTEDTEDDIDLHASAMEELHDLWVGEILSRRFGYHEFVVD